MKPTVDALVDRLLRHAGMPRSDEEPDDLSSALWDFRQSGYSLFSEHRIYDAMDDIFDIVMSVDDILFEKRSAIPPRDRRLPDTLVYGVNGIVLQLLGTAREARASGVNTEAEQTILEYAELLTFTWDLFLAGDISDLREAVRIELEMNGGTMFPALKKRQ